ncbi:EDSAP-1 family PEP-CTERM protein [Aquisalimonas sp. APHAB1-3]
MEITDMLASKRLGISMVTALALGVGGIGAAHASAMTYSQLSIFGFQVFKSDGTTQWDVSDFDNLAVGNSGSTSASLNSIPGSDGDSISPTSGPVDPAQACQGADCGGIPQNTFEQQPSGQHFSRGDARLEGALITGLEGPSEVTADTVSEIQLSRSDGGTASANLGTNTEFRFMLNEENSGEALDFQFSAVKLMEAMLGEPEGSVFVDQTFRISIRDEDAGQTIFAFSPDGSGARGITGGQALTDECNLNDEFGRTNNPGTSDATCSGNFRAVTNELMSGTNYSLNISHNAFTSASVQVPEPGTLALFGLGLLGVGAAGLRRRRS